MTVGLIVLYIVLVLIRPQEYVQGMENVPILSVVFVVTFFIWMISVKKDFSIPQPLLMTLFVLVATLSVVAAGWSGGAMDAFMTLLPGWGIFIMLSMTINSIGRLKLLLDVIAICAFLLALHSIEQYITGYGWTGLPLRPDDGRVHYLGIFNDPNDLGTLFVTAVPITIHWLGRESSGPTRFLYFLMMLSLLVAIYLTDSRGSLLAVGTVGLMELGRRYGKVVAGTGVLVLGVLAAAYTRLADISVNEASAAGRVDAWFQGFEMFKSSPVLGIGFRNFTEHHSHTAHNSFVLVLAETGIIGFYFWLTILSVTFLVILNFLRKSAEDLGIQSGTEKMTEWKDYRQLTWTFLVLLCGYIVAISFLSRSYDSYFNIVFGLSAGLCLALQSKYQALPKFRIVDRMGGWAASTVGGVFVTYAAIKVLLVMQG